MEIITNLSEKIEDNKRLTQNLDEWFKIKTNLNKKDYEMIKKFTHKTENE